MDNDLFEDRFKDYPAIGGVMASKMVTVDKHPVSFIYREQSINKQDSGWRVFSGLENQEYADNPDNFAFYNPTSIFKIDDSIAKLLLNPVGSVYEREGLNGNWFEVDDFDFEEEIIIHKLDDNWTISISDLFWREMEDEDTHAFGMKDKTIRIMISEFKGKNQDEILEEAMIFRADRDKNDTPIIKEYNLDCDSIIRVGYLVNESDETKTYNVLYSHSIVDGETAFAAIYFNKDSDEEWAIETWKSISYKHSII